MSNILNNYPCEGVIVVVFLLAAIAIIGSIYLIARVTLSEIRAIRSELEAVRNDNRALAAELQKWKQQQKK